MAQDTKKRLHGNDVGVSKLLNTPNIIAVLFYTTRL